MPSSIKTIKGHEYLYYTYYEKGKKIDVYCGLASKPESKKKLLEIELNHVKKQIENYQVIQRQLENKIKNI